MKIQLAQFSTSCRAKEESLLAIIFSIKERVRGYKSSIIHRVYNLIDSSIDFLTKLKLKFFTRIAILVEKMQAVPFHYEFIE